MDQQDIARLNEYRIRNRNHEPLNAQELADFNDLVFQANQGKSY